MKKIVCVLISLFLVSCFGSRSETPPKVEEPLASGSINNTGTIISSGSIDDEVASADIPTINIQNNENQVFRIFPLSGDMLTNNEIEIKGETLSSDIEKIEVSFENRESSFPTDIYTLTTYKKWNKNFRYVASANFRVLDYGTNTYEFTAFLSSWEKEIIPVEIYLPKNMPQKNVTPSSTPPVVATKIAYEKQLFWTGTGQQYVSFPKSSTFWNPIFDGEESLTYSNLPNFEVKKIVGTSPLCEKSEDLTQFLVDQYWFIFWNTCRPVITGKGFSFYALRLKWEKYLYEKHYIDSVHSLHGILLLETGTGITKDNIEEKNTEFKERTFEEVKIPDALMYEIMR